EDMQKTIIEKRIKLYNIDALKIATEVGLGSRVNTVMQAAFFIISKVLDRDEAIKMIKAAIEKSYIKKGMDIVEMNWTAVDTVNEKLVQIEVPAEMPAEHVVAKALISEDADDFTKNIIEPIMREKGDDIPVSHMPFDGFVPSATTKLEKRGVSPVVPKWVAEDCIQCNQCALVCPHAAIRPKLIKNEELEGAPESFQTLVAMGKDKDEYKYKIQVYIEDCQGCRVCVNECPKGALVMNPIEDERVAGENENLEFFESLPEDVLGSNKETTVKGSQFKQPLLEFSGACAGCGETPYAKLITQLYGDRMIIANATGCSSIWGGTFPTIPYCKNQNGHGPAWANSLFEDNAEYGFGMRLAVDSNRTLLRNKMDRLLEIGTTSDLTAALKKNIELWEDKSSEAILAQTATALLLQPALRDAEGESKKILTKMAELKDYFIDKSVWIIGGDGWAYDIGYGGLDHVVAAGKNVNILVLDTEVYSNTGGQASKATPIAAVAKFANAGMRMGKKNLAMMCMSYGYVYVASIAMGANRIQTQKAIMEAEAYNGPSIIIAYSPCIAHGFDMSESQAEQKKAVDSGYWPLFRYNPEGEEGKRFKWETKEPKLSYQDFIRGEARYSSLLKTAPDEAEALFKEAEIDAKRRMNFYKKLGEIL
ncbi:MAG: 2-oxoacid:acceptor oxidoreductase family protein, partial [Spirochaetales bacterium]|nr:2-oxoacid:acceptor oxidoreductase family protein [Spirochaetales bacterium]